MAAAAACYKTSRGSCSMYIWSCVDDAAKCVARQGRVEGEIRTNLAAVREHSERVWMSQRAANRGN